MTLGCVCAGRVLGDCCDTGVCMCAGRVLGQCCDTWLCVCVVGVS